METDPQKKVRRYYARILRNRVEQATLESQSSKKTVKAFLEGLSTVVKVKLRRQDKDFAYCLRQIERGYWKDVTPARMLRVLDKIRET